jgi:hypothetical protein
VSGSASGAFPGLGDGPEHLVSIIVVDLSFQYLAGCGVRQFDDEAALQLAKAGCASIEAMSGIDIRSAHDFFRRLGFAETSYLFAKPL